MHSSLSLDELHARALANAKSPQHGVADLAASGLETSPQGLIAASWRDGRLESLRFQSTPDPLSNAFLELFCRQCEGLPCEEAAAYGASYVLHQLSAGRPVTGCAGILSIDRVHPELAAAQRALRAFRPAWRSTTAMPAIDRADFLALPEQWQVLSPDQRLAMLRQTLADALACGDLADVGLAVDRLEDDIRGRAVRITLSYPKTADLAGLPDQMRRIEAIFRSKVAPWLEVYAEERQDHNKLRRTILIDQRPNNA